MFVSTCVQIILSISTQPHAYEGTKQLINKQFSEGCTENFQNTTDLLFHR